MSIDGGLLFCEGKTDLYVLNSLLKGLVNQPTLVPTNGKHGMWAFVSGYLKDRYPKKKSAYLVFRDRDFDRQPADSKLIAWKEDSSNKVFLSHRACIENYLLEPTFLHAYWDYQSQGRWWRFGPPPVIELLHKWQEDAARKLVPYQATRWALSSIIPGERWPRVESTWTEGSGKLPKDLDKDHCIEAAQDLIGGYQKKAEQVSFDSFKTHYAHFEQMFLEESFWTQREYMIWFHGKDLRKAMTRVGSNSLFTQFPLKSFCEHSWFESQDFTHFPGLAELKQKIDTFFS